MMYELFILPNINMIHIPSKKVLLIGFLSVVVFFALGILSNSTNDYYSRAKTIVRQMAANSQAYAETSETLLQERAHCSIADEIQIQLTKLQATNASLRRELELMNLPSKKE